MCSRALALGGCPERVQTDEEVWAGGFADPIQDDSYLISFAPALNRFSLYESLQERVSQCAQHVPLAEIDFPDH